MKLIAIDLDGTLLQLDGTISEVNRQAIDRVQEAGHRVTICSGRALHDILEILRKNQIEASIIAGNGALVYHEKILQHLTLPVPIVRKLIEWAESTDLYYEIYTNEGILSPEHGRKLLEKERDQLLAMDSRKNRESLNRKIAIQFDQHHLQIVPDLKKLDFAKNAPYKFYICSFFPEKRQTFQEKLAELDNVSLTSGASAVIEVGHPDASKAFGLKYLADYFHIPLKNTVAIGDNLNDISMFQVAGISIAMANGREEAKQAATYVTKSRDEDGVAYALKKYVLGDKTG